MKNKNRIIIVVLVCILSLWVVSMKIAVKNSDAQISECNRKIEQLQSSNQEFEKLNNERTEALQVFEDKTKALEEELAQLKQEVKDTKCTNGVEGNQYLEDFKSLYEKGDWTKDEKDKLIDLFLLIQQNHTTGIEYDEYLDETPDMTMANLIKTGEETSIEYWRLFRLVEESDGALSEMTFGFLYNQFLEDGEGLFKANFYGQRNYSTISWQLFPYDSEVYPLEYQDEMIAIYNDILKKDSLEQEFRAYIQKEMKEAEGAFGRK